MHGSIWPVTTPLSPGNPRDKFSSLGPGLGNCLKRSFPGGRGGGGGANRKYLLFDFAKYVSSCAVWTMAADLKTTYFQNGFLCALEACLVNLELP